MEIRLFLILPLACIFVFLLMVDRTLKQVDPECGGLKFGQAIILTLSIFCFGFCGFITGMAKTEKHFTERVIPELRERIILESQERRETFSWEITEVSSDTLLLINRSK